MMVQLQVLSLCLALWATEAQTQTFVDVECNAAGTFDVSDLGADEVYRFTSHAGYGSTMYGPSRCNRKFKKGNSCDGLEISCSDSFDVTNSRPTRCNNRGGDTLQMRNDEINQRFCGSSSPDFITTSEDTLKANFRPTGSGDGFECFASCAMETPPPTPTGCNCGQAMRSQRIVGGEMTENNEYPWQVLLTDNLNNLERGFYCGGVVISSLYVLSAAHCFSRSGSISGEYAQLGDHDISRSGETDAIAIEIDSVLRHPSYNSRRSDYDYAILRLSEPIDFDAHPHIRPACMPSAEAVEGETSVTTGWGTLEEGGDISTTLQEVTLPIVDRDTCSDLYRGITTRMVCAGDVEDGGIDACQGDSGGPLVVMRGNNYELNGITSFGNGCARPGSPGVWASVYNQRQWIYDNTDLTEGSDGCPRL